MKIRVSNDLVLPLHGGEVLGRDRPHRDDPAEWRVLEAAIRAYPRPLTRDELAAAVTPPYDARGGRFNNILGKLRSAALIEGNGSAILAGRQLVEAA